MVKNTSPSSLSQSRASLHLLHLQCDQLWEYPFPSREEASLHSQAGLVPCGLKSQWLTSATHWAIIPHGPQPSAWYVAGGHWVLISDPNCFTP